MTDQNIDNMTVELVDMNSIIMDPANLRKHGTKNHSAIKASLARFKQRKPIVVDKNNIIRAGNGTYAAAKELGWTHIKIVRFEDMEGAEAIAYAIADNRTSDLSEWYEDELNQTLKSLSEDGFNLDDIGFDIDDRIERFGNNDASGNEGLTDPDNVPEIEQNIYGVKTGDIWTLGNHRLMCGDSTSKEDVDRLMDGQKADMVFTDPPYGIGYEYASHDDSDSDVNYKLVNDVFKLHDCGKVWTPGLCNLSRDIIRFGKTKIAVWYKKFAMAGSGIGGASTWEPILILNPQEKKLNNDVIQIMTEREILDGVSLRKLHSCPKPVELYKHLILAFSSNNSLICEPFCGSGTTLIACEQTSRKCFGMEIDFHYCSVIIKRWEYFTGKKAEKIN